MRTVQEEWERYALSCIPPEAPEVQYTETRRAFFAGAAAVMNRVIEIGNDPISQEEGCRILEALEAECRQFCLDVAEGRK